MITMDLKTAQKKVEEAKAGLETAEKDLHEALGRTYVKCETSNYGKGCGAKTQIRNLVYIRTHWYVTPYGCTEGDYWLEGEGQFDCPKCGVRNRFTDAWGNKGRENFIELQHHFKEIKKQYDRDW